MPTSTPQIVTRLVQLGESPDPANNFFLRAEGDGTLSIARCSDGRVAATIDAANKVTFPGNAQAMQDVKASRIAGNTYRNDTGQPITVHVCLKSTVAGAAVRAPVVPGAILFGSSGVAGQALSLTFVVPPGAEYSCGVDTGIPTIISWAEVR